MASYRRVRAQPCQCFVQQGEVRVFVREVLDDLAARGSTGEAAMRVELRQ